MTGLLPWDERACRGALAVQLARRAEDLAALRVLLLTVAARRELAGRVIVALTRAAERLTELSRELGAGDAPAMVRAADR